MTCPKINREFVVKDGTLDLSVTEDTIMKCCLKNTKLCSSQVVWNPTFSSSMFPLLLSSYLLPSRCESEGREMVKKWEETSLQVFVDCATQLLLRDSSLCDKEQASLLPVSSVLLFLSEACPTSFPIFILSGQCPRLYKYPRSRLVGQRQTWWVTNKLDLEQLAISCSDWAKF